MKSKDPWPKDRWPKFIFQFWLTVLSIALGVGVQSFLRHRQGPGDPSSAWRSFASGAAGATERADFSSSRSGPLTSGEGAAPARLNAIDRARIQDCAPELGVESLASLDDFRGVLLKGVKAGSWNRELLWQNRHFRLGSGDERRVRINLKEVPGEPTAEPQYGVQIYKMSEDGLPELLPMFAPAQVDPARPELQEMFKNAEEIYEAHAERYRTGVDPSAGSLLATVRYENNRVTMMEYANERGFLRCLGESGGEPACLCRRVRAEPQTLIRN